METKVPIIQGQGHSYKISPKFHSHIFLFIFQGSSESFGQIDEALLGKWGWELATNQNHFWARIVMSKYGGWNALIHGRNSTAFSNWWKDLKSIFQQQHTNRLSNNLCLKLVS